MDEHHSVFRGGRKIRQSDDNSTALFCDFKEIGGGSIEHLSGRKFEICLGEFKEGKDIHPFCAIRFAFCGKESLGMYALHYRLALLEGLAAKCARYPESSREREAVRLFSDWRRTPN